MYSVLLSCIMVVYQAVQTDGHGRLVSPAGRSTMWRYGFQTPHNTNDNQLSCGGFGAQFYKNGGKCGICGDPYDAVRENEAGGKYATGTIAKSYQQGSVITVQVDVTVNHGGWFEFRLCPNNDPKSPATQQCLDKFLLQQTDGVTRIYIPGGLGIMQFHMQLPKQLTCSQCVLQWKYNTASNVRCDGSKCCRGCGPQEQFYGCADIAITTGSTSGSSSGGNPNTGVWHPVQVVPNNNQPQGQFPGSFIPVSSGSNNQPSHNSGNVLPSGPVGVPNVNLYNCQATTAFKLIYPSANQWCVTNCRNGNCPIAYCSRSCLSDVISGSSTTSACRATDEWRSANPNADNWCRNTCNAGICPFDYCDRSCGQ